MAGLSDMLENYRNWRGRSEWEQGKAIQDIYGGDVRGQEQFEKFGGFGTDAGGLVGMVKASHGSPHAFTKFLMSKLGTGEGAQAYGHGLYFGEGFDSPTARQYQKDLSGFYEPFLGEKSGQQLSDLDLDVLKHLEIGQRNAGNFPHNTVYYAKKAAESKPETLAALEALPRDIKFGEKLNTGNLYNVELRWPDAAREAADPLSEEHFLHWDKPISEQPEGIKQIIGKLSSEMTGPVRESMIGDEYLRHLQGILKFAGRGDEKAESLLKEYGIPGIRYLDQGSRGAGTGTHNYVIFDEDIPNIVSRNGVSLSDLLRR